MQCTDLTRFISLNTPLSVPLAQMGTENRFHHHIGVEGCVPYQLLQGPGQAGPLPPPLPTCSPPLFHGSASEPGLSMGLQWEVMDQYILMFQMVNGLNHQLQVQIHPLRSNFLSGKILPTRSGCLPEQLIQTRRFWLWIGQMTTIII